MTIDPEPVCVLAMNPGALRSGLEAELMLDGYAVRVGESIPEVEARLTPSVADLLIVGTLDERAASCALLRGLRAGRLGEGRVTPGLPAIAIVPDGDITSLLRAFECGADDVVAQPVRYPELRARLTALMRRANRDVAPEVQRIGELTIDRAARQVAIEDTTVELSAKEWKLLEALASQPSKVFTKQELLRIVWQTDWVGTSRTLDSHACRLRAKLAEAGARNSILNVWGVGYRLTDASTVAHAA